DSHVDLEFLQLPVSLVPSASCVGGTNAGQPCLTDADCPPSGSCKGRVLFPCQGKFKGGRTAGDLLVAVDFTRGGALGGVSLFVWDCGNATPAADGSCNPTGAKGGPHYMLSAAPANAVRTSINGGHCSVTG